MFTDELFGFSIKGALESYKAPEACYASIEGATPKELEVATAFVLQGNTSTRGLIVLLRDITELRRLQAVNRRNDRMKELGEMAAASLLVRDLEERADLQQMAQYIVDGTITLDRLVNDVLNYSRPLQLHFEHIDLSSQLIAATEIVKADTALAEKLTITLELPSDPIVIPLDIHLFRSALLNLISNGAQAMPDKGSMTFTASIEGNAVQLLIRDTGVGIPKENLEKVFSPFFTTKTKGNGLGLAEVHKIVLAHGGTIDVSSEEGQGTTFTIKLRM